MHDQRAADLVRALRYRRTRGRTNLKRGTPPAAPRIGYANNGCLMVALVAVIGYAASLAISLAFRIAVDLAVVVGGLCLIREFRTWAFPIVRGKPLDSKALATCAPVTTFAMGALPVGAVAFATAHDAIPVAVSAVVGGLAFRPVVTALDGTRLPPISKLMPKTQSLEAATIADSPDLDVPGDFGLWIGQATGHFANLGHRAGVQTGSDLTLNLRDAAKNIAIFGETGTGKTTRVVNHLLVQALDFDAGALIVDVRGDFYDTAQRAAELTGKTLQRIGIGHLGINLLEGLTPNTAAGFLEAAFKLLGQGEGDSAFWLSLAVARCQNALTVLNHVPGEYSLKALYRYVFDDHFRERAIASANDALIELQVRAADGDTDAALDSRRLQTALDYELTVAAKYSDKERSGLNRTIETALARFTDPELEDAFCTAHNAQARLDDVLDGAVFVVNVPRERFKAAARVVYLFLKERFFQALNTRAQMPPGPCKDRPVLFLCDEYQQICSAGDADFFDTSRALGVVGVVASQSIEAYINAVGNEHAAAALLANFANIIAFRSTEHTMNFIAGKLGDVDVYKQSYNAGKSSAKLFQANISEGQSVSLERQKLLNPQLFRTLAPDKAIALLTVNGAAYDDVIVVPQITTDDLL